MDLESLVNFVRRTRERPIRLRELIPGVAIAIALLLGWGSVGAGAWRELIEQGDWLQGSAALALFLVGAVVLIANAIGYWRRYRP